MQLYAVYEIGPQGIMIDTDFRADLESCKRNIESCSYGFKPRKEYVCLPVFSGPKRYY